MREYLLEKWGRKCAYCGVSGVPLEVEHIVPNYDRLQQFGLPVEVGTGGQTKYNRLQQGYPKTHWLDAVCVGQSGDTVYVSPTHRPLYIQATGRQSR